MSGQWYFYTGSRSVSVPDGKGGTLLVRPRKKFVAHGESHELRMLLRNNEVRRCSPPKVVPAPKPAVEMPEIEPAQFRKHVVDEGGESVAKPKRKRRSLKQAVESLADFVPEPEPSSESDSGSPGE